MSAEDKKEPTVEVKRSELEFLIELSCCARGLAWSVKNYRDKLQDGIAVGEAISEVLSCDDKLNEILTDYANFHKYD